MRMDRFRAKEPPLEEMLDDPIVRLVMMRDGIGRDDAAEHAGRRISAPSALRPRCGRGDGVLPAGVEALALRARSSAARSGGRSASVAAIASSEG